MSEQPKELHPYSADDRTRDSHLAADGQIKPMNEAFDVGGYKMMYPGDMSKGAPVDEIIICRCTIAPVIDV